MNAPLLAVSICVLLRFGGTTQLEEDQRMVGLCNQPEGPDCPDGEAKTLAEGKVLTSARIAIVSWEGSVGNYSLPDHEAFRSTLLGMEAGLQNLRTTSNGGQSPCFAVDARV